MPNSKINVPFFFLFYYKIHTTFLMYCLLYARHWAGSHSNKGMSTHYVLLLRSDQFGRKDSHLPMVLMVGRLHRAQSLTLPLLTLPLGAIMLEHGCGHFLHHRNTGSKYSESPGSYPCGKLKNVLSKDIPDLLCLNWTPVSLDSCLLAVFPEFRGIRGSYHRHENSRLEFRSTTPHEFTRDGEG